MICKVCKKEVEHPSPYEEVRGGCSSCLIQIREKERKTFGWIFYHLLKLERKFGKMIIKGEECSQTKYGLQEILVNRIKNKVIFNFYFGRSFIHRPILVVDLFLIEKYKNEILQLIRNANNNRDLNPIPSLLSKSENYREGSGNFRDQDGYYLEK